MKILILVFALCSQVVQASVLRIATSANFVPTLEVLKINFEKTSSSKLEIVSGATGKLAGQIIAGAPYDAFLSADDSSAEKLIHAKKASETERFIYATGKMVLYSKIISFDQKFELKKLKKLKFNFLAMANPELAPYGKAAQVVLQKSKILNGIQKKIVFGENIAETFHFVSSGNAKLGFVSLSQVINLDQKNYWIVPQENYSPLRQEAILLTQTKNPNGVKNFFEYLKSDEAKKIMRQFGYE